MTVCEHPTPIITTTIDDRPYHWHCNGCGGDFDGSPETVRSAEARGHAAGLAEAIALLRDCEKRYRLVAGATFCGCADYLAAHQPTPTTGASRRREGLLTTDPTLPVVDPDTGRGWLPISHPQIAGLRAHMETLRARLAAVEAERDEARAEAIRQRGRYEKLLQRVEDLLTERDAMRSVVDAARYLVAKRNEEHGQPDNPEWWRGWDFRLVAAVAAYDAAQNITATPPRRLADLAGIDPDITDGQTAAEHIRTLWAGLPETMTRPVSFDTGPDEGLRKVKLQPVDEAEDTWDATATPPQSTHSPEQAEDAPTATPDAETPAWLAEAVEVVARLLYNGAGHSGVDWWVEAPAETRRRWRVKATAAIRAAAPIIRRDALLRAADAIEAFVSGPEPFSEWGKGYRRGLLVAKEIVRDRAGVGGDGP